ncbi:MAG: glycosyltransferase family 87 protein [Acidimicrobiales bacterium]
MPGTIETDGPGALTRQDPRPSGHVRTWRPLDGLRRRWGRFAPTPARGVLAVVATVALWGASAARWASLCLHIDRTENTLGWDLQASWRAEVVFVHGGQPYSQAATDGRLFLYPPSALLVDRPLAWLSLHQLKVFGLVATALLVWLTVMISSALLRRRWWGLTSAAVVLGLGFAPAMVDELKLGNVSVVCALALAVFYVLAVKGHWVPAGVAIGLTLAVKPLLLPILLVFLLARKWRALAITVAVPALLNAVAFAVVKDPSAVFSKLPSLLNRSGSGVFFNSAWVDVMRAPAFPDFVTLLVRLLTAALALVVAWWAWNEIDDAAVRIVTTSSILLIGTYLAGTLSESHFMLTLVPLAMTVVIAGAPMRWASAWVGVLLFMGLTPPRSLLGMNSDANFSAFRAFGMSIVLLSVFAALLYRRRQGAAPSAAGHEEQPDGLEGDLAGSRSSGRSLDTALAP